MSRYFRRGYRYVHLMALLICIEHNNKLICSQRERERERERDGGSSSSSREPVKRVGINSAHLQEPTDVNTNVFFFFYR